MFSTELKLNIRSVTADALEIAKILKKYEGNIFTNIKTVPVPMTEKGMRVIGNYDLKNKWEVMTLLKKLAKTFIIRKY